MPCAPPEGIQESRSVAPLVLHFGTRWINYTLRPLYPERGSQYPLSLKLDGLGPGTGLDVKFLTAAEI